ncbi:MULTISPECIES: amidohydrolase [Halocynthiibacter]|uniref:Amidohydrolase n=1 Tax=Halocynthiibacter halioticoli TaxID=2986804 RepID=A0AAE3J0M3_9RHOB|nr:MULTISPECIES: amidohydrolase [Halocynthiibacter]MCV6825802.1 amidohydrolase [Halocynthiibacter halioticoli]MCW4058803.1 amidohydrolase [Halocynthiibacter sp. SDUM655004]
MFKQDRRSFLKSALFGATCLTPIGQFAFAQSSSLTDIGAAMGVVDQVTIYTAREIVTLDPDQPSASAVAVVNGRILGVGDVETLTEALADQPYEIDETFADKVIVPGFIAQHDHPVLAGLCMSSEILSIEDWVLPAGTVPAVKDKADFLTRLKSASEAIEDPDEPLLTWGYHSYFYGKLTREDLDGVSETRPIIVFARSCHEFTLNSVALEKGGVDEELLSGWSQSAQNQSNLEEGHFWEQGVFAILPSIAPLVFNPEKFVAGLELMRDYMHAKGVTFGNEPGGILSKDVQDMVNSVMSAPSMPFRWTFMADAKSLIAKYDDDATVISETEKLASWYGGMTSLAEGSAKLFADGAIYSLAMQLRDPLLDDQGHGGVWMMDEDKFLRGFQVYWDAGYQIHIHVNGDAGLDRVLNALEVNMRRNPRFDHRTVIVHFAVSDSDQIPRIKELGAIVSANPYYVRALSDKYGEVGLGPQRADSMVRLGDLEEAGIPYSLHSDMPMAPGDPLFLMWCAVNRVTFSGRVADADQRASREKALRGVTLDAAYSHRMEDELGSIQAGKRANMTILEENPLTVDAMKIKDIKVWGTVMEGTKLKVGYQAQEDAFLAPNISTEAQTRVARAALNHALSVVHSHL